MSFLSFLKQVMIEFFSIYDIFQTKQAFLFSPFECDMQIFFPFYQSELFQEDIYPDAISDEAACEAADWLDGVDPKPKLVKMQTFFKGSVKASGSATGGGLKKGGLKGLKAKKDAKAAGKEADPAPVVAAPAKSTSSETKVSDIHSFFEETSVFFLG